MFKRRNRALVVALLVGALVAGLATQASAMPKRPALSVPGSNNGGTQTPVRPHRPTGLTADLDDGGVLLSWDAPDETVDSWQVLRKFRPAETVHTVIATVDGEWNEWTDTDVTAGDRRYKITAVRDSLTSRRSRVAKLVIEATPRPTPGTITKVPAEKPTTVRAQGDACSHGGSVAITPGTTTGLTTTQDWVQVALTSNVEYQIYVYSYSGESRINFVCGPTETEIADTGAAPGTGLGSQDGLLNFTPSTTGLHYVKMTTAGAKTVRVVDLSDDLCADDKDTTCTAAVGAAATEGTIDTPTDYDWVKVPLVNGTAYQIDLRSDGYPRIDPWIVDIYDTRGDKIMRPAESFTWAVYNGYFDHDSGPGTAARLVYTAAENGNHFIKIGSRGSSRQRLGDWHLQVTEASAPFYDDYAADISTTGTVSVGGTVSGWIDATPAWYDAGDTGGPSVGGREPGWTDNPITGPSCYEFTGDGIKLDRNTCDRDWFAVDLANNRSYKLQLGEFYRMIVGVYDSSGALIRASTAEDFVVFRASYAGKHYIAVAGTSSCRAAAGCTGQYTLRVTQR